MVKSYIFILFFWVLLVPGTIHAQPASATDSLQQKAQEATGSERAELLLELAEKIWRSDTGSGIKHAEEAIRIARRDDNENLEARALIQRGAIFSAQDKHARALEDYLAALEITRSTGNQIGEASALHNLGLLYQNQSNYAKALDYYFQSLRIKEDRGDKVSAAHTLTFIGIIYQERNELENAIEYYRRAVSLSEEANDLKEIAITAGQTANALKEAGRSEEAIAMFRKALDAADRLGSNHARATILLDMSSVYQSQKAYEEAIEINRQEVESARESGSRFLEAQGLENLGGIYDEMGNTGEAVNRFEAAKAIFDKLGIGDGSIRTRTKLAQIYLSSAHYTAAISEGLGALSRAVESKDLDAQRDILQILSEVYLNQGNFRDAFQAQNQLLAVKDSAFGKEQERQIQEMRVRYETAQKEQEIALLQQKQEKATLIRNAFIGGIILVIIIGLLVYNRQRLKIKKNRAELENTRLKEQQLKQDLEFKNKQLTTHSLHLVQKNETMKELKEHIEDLGNRQDGNSDRALQKLKNMVDYSFSLDEDWEQFQLYFEEVHTGFFDALKKQHPDLTANELRLSALVKLNLSSKEIATILGITSDSVKTARYRLRKKLDMDTEENLTEFMMNVEREIGV